MTTVYKTPVIVPRREDLPGWLGTPLGSNVLVNLTQQTEFGAGGQGPTKFWRYDWDSDTRTYNWPPQASNVLVNLTQQKEFGAGGQSPTKLWRYDLDTDARLWVWPGDFPFIPQIPTAEPFYKLWRYDYVPDTLWTIGPQAAPFNVLGGEVRAKFWRYDYDSGATQWTWTAPGSNVLDELVEGGAPFNRLWRYDLDTDARSWTWSGDTPFIPQIPAAASTFSKFWRYDLDTDTRLWTWTGDFPFVPQIPAGAQFSAIKQPVIIPRRDDLPVWLGQPVGGNILNEPVVGSPFYKLWRYDSDQDVRLWTWSGESPVIPRIPASTNPFSKFWRWDYDSGSVPWVWSGDTPFIPQVPSAINPFKSTWRWNDGAPATQWTWTAPGQPIINQLTQLYMPVLLQAPDPGFETAQWQWQPPAPHSLLYSTFIHIGLSAISLVTVGARGGMTGAASLLAKTLVAIKDGAAETVPTIFALGRTIASVFGRASPQGTTSLNTLTLIQVKAASAPTGKVGLLAKAFAQVIAGAQPSTSALALLVGTINVAVRDASRGALSTTLQASGKILGRVTVSLTGTVPLKVKATTQVGGRGLSSNLLVLFGNIRSAIRDASTGVFSVTLQAAGKVSSRVTDSVTGKTSLAAKATVQTSMQANKTGTVILQALQGMAKVATSMRGIFSRWRASPRIAKPGADNRTATALKDNRSNQAPPNT